MNIDEAMSYIKKVSSLGTLPGLERIEYILNGLNNPQNGLKIIHVAGTNGKGSFSAMFASVLREAGYSVGLFTSPHMIKYNERINYNGEDISDGDISRLLEPIVKIAKGMKDTPSEFEITTALGYSYFAEKRPDFCIIECGMGGRWDATNVVNNPVLSVITGVALDHMSFLGNTVEEIATEKSGIIKKGCPFLYGGDEKNIDDILLGIASKKEAPYFRTSRKEIKNVKCTVNGTSFDYIDYKNIELSLIGHYQPYNAANVIEAVEIIGKNYPISKQALYKGLKNAKWIGRFEKISENPYVFFDGGHNPEGVLETVKSVKEIFGDAKINVVSGVLKDKDYHAVASSISTVANKVFTVTPDSYRALSAEKYSEVYKKLGVESNAFGSFDDAIKSAYEESKKEGRPLLCVGSLYSYPDFINSFKRLRDNNG